MALEFFIDTLSVNVIMFDQFLSYFIFNEIEIAVLSVFFLICLVQVFFYLNYYRKPYSYAKKKGYDNSSYSSSKPKVSVIIASENEAEELAKNLPSILEQDYSDFEVVVVNDGSTDESEVLLQSLKLKYSHLYFTYLPYSKDNFFGRRKLALTIGIKAAKGDILLFTEPYARPVSDKWIAGMVNELSDSKEVVLGYSFYKRSKSFFNSMARFDNLLFSMQYLSMAINNKGYIGTYRNVAFKKHLFFDNKGFASHLNVENGEDVFLNQIITGDNTSVAICQDSFVETSIERYSLWKQIKKSYFLAKANIRSSAASVFGLETFSRYFFYLLLTTLVIYAIFMQHWALLGISVVLFLIRLAIQMLVVNKSAKHFYSGKFYLILILLDVLQPIYNLRFISTRNGKLRSRR
ncbi:MAG: glycosyltransferase [Dysgonomonas sp.]